MNRALVWLAIALSLAACRTPRVETPPATDVVGSEAPSPDASPGPPCERELPAALATGLDGFRLALPDDFLSVIRELDASNPNQDLTCTLVTADFNQDGLDDYALLLMQTTTSQAQARLMLNQGNGQYRPLVLIDYDRHSDAAQGLVYTSMNYKPPGEPGLAARDYSPLEGEAETAYIARPAISLWQDVLPDTDDVPPDLTDINNLAYCSNSFYFIDGALTSFVLCD